MTPTKPKEQTWSGRTNCQAKLMALEAGPLLRPNPAWPPEANQRLEEIRLRCKEAEAYLWTDIKARNEQPVSPSAKTWSVIRQACEVWGELSGQAEAELDQKKVQKLEELMGQLWGMIP